MRDDIEEFVKSYDHCAQSASKPIKKLLHPWPDVPWPRVYIDFAGSIHGQWVCIIVDSYTKFVEAGLFPQSLF